MSDNEPGFYLRREIYAMLCSLASAGHDRHPEYLSALRDVALAFAIDWDSIERVAWLMVVNHAGN